jgi:hypothetical protein
VNRSIVLACFLVLAQTAQATGAVAQAPDANTIAARARFKEGVAFYDKGDFENARAAFLKAYALRRHPGLLLNLGQSCLRAGRVLEAEGHLALFLRDAKEATPEQRAEAQKALTAARAKLGSIEFDAPEGTLIALDGDPLGKAPQEPKRVLPGAHVVRFTPASGVAETRNVSVLAGQSVKTEIAAPIVVPPPVPVPVAAVAPEAPAPVETPPPPKKPGAWAPPENFAPIYVAGGVAVVGLATSVLFGVVFRNQAQSAAEDVAGQIRSHAATDGRNSSGICASPPANYVSACKTLADNNSAADTDALVGNIALAVSVAALAGGTVYYFAATKKGARTAAGFPWLTPTVSSHGGGVTLSGRF